MACITRFLRANAIQHGIGTDALGQRLYPLHPFLTALGDAVSGAELPRKFVPSVVGSSR